LGGQIFIYSCSAQLIYFEIDYFTVCEHEYMNICPRNYRYSGASEENTKEIMIDREGVCISDTESADSHKL
jgi:hypothetical protein